MISLKDKVVIITGGGRGIGFGLSTAFAKAGAKLVITGRTESTLLSAKEKLEAAHGCEVLTVTADGADEAAIQNVIDKTVERFGKIDAVINNALGFALAPGQSAGSLKGDGDTDAGDGFHHGGNLTAE